MTTHIKKNGDMHKIISIAEIPETDCDYFLIDGMKAYLDSYDDSSVTLVVKDCDIGDNENDPINWSTMVVNFTENDIFDIEAVFESE